MRDVLDELRAFRTGGEHVGRAVLTGVVGSAPRPEGAAMVVGDAGSMAGSVSGGCIEGAVFEEVQRAIQQGEPARLSYGVSDETAWDVGLACGGTFEILVQPAVSDDVEAAASADEAAVIATILDGPAGATGMLVMDAAGHARPGSGHAGTWDGPLTGAAAGAVAAIELAAGEALGVERSRSVALTTDDGPLTVFLEVFPPRPRLIVFGGVHVAVALVGLARGLGYRTIVADGRAAFANRERFPDADEVIVAWPEEAFARIGLDRSSYVAVLTHDPKFDEPALAIALHSPARYVGAIGSRRTQEARRARLREAGVSDEELARLRGPIGLDLGGRGAAEIALAILAEITAVRFGGSGGSMSARPERSAAEVN